MGSFFIDLLSFDHEVAVYEKDAKRLRFTYNCLRFTKLDEIAEFKPELVINAVTVKYTLPAFEEVLPWLPKDCIISDIASVKTGLHEFYTKSGFRFVSTHPMFGPTFANLNQLSEENAVIIKEGDYMGKIFFKDLYQQLGLNMHEYTFDEHDQTVAYSLSIPLPALSFCCCDEASGCSGYYLQASHEHCQGRTQRGRLSVARNSLQPLYFRTVESDS